MRESQQGCNYRGSSEEIDSDESLLGDLPPAMTRLTVVDHDHKHATATDHRPKSPHKPSMPTADDGKSWSIGLHSGRRGYDYPLDKTNDPQVLTGCKGKAMVNSSFEVSAANDLCMGRRLTNQEPQDREFHDNSKRDKGESSGVQKEPFPPSHDFAGDKIPSRAVDAYQEHEGVDVAIDIAKNREQEADMVMQIGPNLGLSPYSRNDPLSNLGLTPLKNNEEDSK